MILTLAIALFAFGSPIFAETTPAPATPAPGPVISVATVEARLMRDVVLATGLIAAVEQVQVAPLIEGQPIEALLADVGDTVAAGQVLARLSTSTLSLQKSQLNASLGAARATISQGQAQLIDAQSASDEAVRVAARTDALTKQGTVSQANADKATAAAVSATSRLVVATQSLESARANLAMVEAQLANVDLQLARAEVKAPVAGEITARNAQVGAIASAAGQPMFTLIREGALEMRADVAEGDLARLATAQTVALHFAGDPAQRPGLVRLIEPSIDINTRMGRARISLTDATGIRPGMFAQAQILVAERSGLAVPITALGVAEGRAFVLRVTGTTANRVEVETGIRDGAWVEITAGLAAGDLLVAKAGAFVRDGDTITPLLTPTPTN